MRFRVGSIGAATFSVVALAGCVPWESDDTVKVAPVKASAPSAQMIRQAGLATAAKAKANELGQIPVLMYHRVVDNATGADDRTPQQFRTELERLARENYVPITAAEYVTGRIGIPAGKHPVVLTFDDSSPSQLTLDGMGTPAPQTAVGILLDVAKRNPGFRPVATFYVTGDLFGKTRPEEQAQMLTWLQENHFDVGNHTRDHRSLGGRPEKEVNADIAAGHKLITSLSKGTPVTLALPYGNQPRTKKWALQGTTGGVRYDYGGVFLAGYTPAASPFSKDFDPAGLPRIRSHDKKGDCVKFCSTAWLDWLKAHPEERFTSDGNIKTVAYPKFKEPFVAKKFTQYTLPY